MAVLSGCAHAGVAQTEDGHDQERPEHQAEEGARAAADLDELLAHLGEDAHGRFERADDEQVAHA